MSRPTSERTVDALVAAARAYRLGQLEQSEAACRDVLRETLQNPHAFHLLGLIAHRRAHPDPSNPGIGVEGPLAAVEASFYANLGAMCQDGGRLDEAIELFTHALQVGPPIPDAYYRLGVALKTRGRLDEAAACFRALLDQWSDHVKAHYSLGNTLRAQGKLDEAAACYREAIRFNPKFARAYYALGNVFCAQGKTEAACAAFRDALRVCPDFPEAHNNLGNVLRERGRFDEALAHYRRAVSLAPHLAEAQNNLGLILQELGHIDEAIPCFERALRIKPDFAEAYNNRGNAYKDAGQIDWAVADYREAIRLKPSFVEAHSNLVYTLNYQPGASAASLLAEHQRWAAAHANSLPAARHPAGLRDPEHRLRVGYVSPDLRRHPVAFFVAPLLAHHDREQFHITCYSGVGCGDAVTARLRATADAWRDIAGRSDAETADLIRRDEIDILVDLAGHTRNNRLLVLARNPAPIQVTYLGYPNTTGLATVDYRLTDAIVDPPGAEHGYTEKLVRLRNGFACYEPPADAPPVAPGPISRRGMATFGSLNDLAKINEEVIDLWCRVLAANPGTRLVVFRNTLAGSTRDRYRQAFAARGVDPARVDLFNTRPGGADFLSVYRLIDVALDPFPWSGHTTTCEALWMGVPVITLLGARSAGRMSASLLTRVGLADLVAESPDAYVRLATELARDRGRLEALRRDLRGRMAASPLCDGRAFARIVEEAYRAMWQRWCAAAPVGIGAAV